MAHLEDTKLAPCTIGSFNVFARLPSEGDDVFLGFNTKRYDGCNVALTRIRLASGDITGAARTVRHALA